MTGIKSLLKDYKEVAMTCKRSWKYLL
jgi:hypothetical protein